MSKKPKPQPILFGTEQQQSILLAAYEQGVTYVRGTPKALRASGLVYEVYVGRKRHLALDPRHPVYKDVLAILGHVSKKRKSRRRIPDPATPWKIPSLPLGYTGSVTFRVLLAIARAKQSATTAHIKQSLHDAWPSSVHDAINNLRASGVIAVDKNGSVCFSSDVPAEYGNLIKKLGDVFAEKDARYALTSQIPKQRKSAFQSGDDGAVRLFEADLRLSNLMTLAKFGPLHVLDLRRTLGGNQIRTSIEDHAPFGRGEVVVTWETPDGLAAALNPNHPAALPLRRLLLKLEAVHPLPPLRRLYAAPVPPEPEPWNPRANLYLFGFPIPTIILMTIAVKGWTFEALCVAVAAKRHRQNVKRALHRMEDEGLLVSDRPRKPGFNVRTVTINPAFSGAAELNDVLAAHLAAWPDFVPSVESALSGLAPRTREHLRRRGLWNGT